MKKINYLLIYIIIFIIIIHLFSIFKYGSCIFLNYNTQITLFVWLFSIFICYKSKNNLFLLMPFLLLAINEFMYIYFNKDIFNGFERTSLLYDLTTISFLKNNPNTNLTEGLYLKNMNDLNSLMSIEECQQLDPKIANDNKYVRFFIDLNIPKEEYSNIHILDIGCGNGDFMKYCKSIGINITGLSISQYQINDLKKKGLHCYFGNYCELQNQFIGKYDIITCWGSLEHIIKAYPCSKYGEKKSKEVLNQIIDHFKKYYKPDSNYKYLFNSTIHVNPNFCNSFDLYLLERIYGGWYFYDKPGKTISDSMEGFNQIYNRDLTYHYYIPSKVDSRHFGNPRKMSIYSIICIMAGFIINPQISGIIIYGLLGEWMWQFDGKHHTKGTCIDCNFEFNKEKRPISLLWFLNKLK